VPLLVPYTWVAAKHPQQNNGSPRPTHLPEACTVCLLQIGTRGAEDPLVASEAPCHGCSGKSWAAWL
jgi:hypothetical protein